jgi:thioredoxin 1
MALEITDATFEQEVLESSKPVLLDFWATWCGPCRTIAPYIDELAKEYEGRAVVGKIDVDANEQVPASYGIRSIPTVLFFKNGELADKLVGAAPKSAFEEKLKALL